MYKAKLQELCQKKKWGLPKYSCMKCGPDHQPRFGASVSVNASSFDSLTPCKSSKQALNRSEPSPRGPITEESSQNLDAKSNVSAVKNDPSIPFIKPNKGCPKDIETPQSLKIQSDAATVIDDIHCQYKIQLQKYAQRKNIGLPSYSIECGGAHASCFKAKVLVGEHIFESLKFFNTSKEAENSAAKAAIMSLLIDNFQKASPYKNRLQELAQEECFCMPLYKTTNYGAPHKPIFKSTVELEGEIFHGKAASSKKQAELDAASVAYVALMERASNRIAASSTSLDLKGRVPKSTPGVGNLEHESQLAPYPAQTYVKDVKENNGIYLHSIALHSFHMIFSNDLHNIDQCSHDKFYEAVLEEGLSSNSVLRTEESSSLLATNNAEKPSSCFESAASSSTESLASPPMLKSKTRDKTTGVTPSYLLCNKVRVYQEFPNHAFPKGITVMPIGNHNWVAISLEFPNEKKQLTE
ncbi:Double-stranded RNA-binding protein 1 [Morus notabilis]|uniref:Double-stranded RNA-binding protein 1 n=1 Tax=Morus notabilis TaxID=981085 RepID=W9RGH4_9ROSA|nr:Double-stranded RNA-binding protein 1 [Morus notabilis]